MGIILTIILFVFIIPILMIPIGLIMIFFKGENLFKISGKILLASIVILIIMEPVSFWIMAVYHNMGRSMAPENLLLSIAAILAVLNPMLILEIASPELRFSKSKTVRKLSYISVYSISCLLIALMVFISIAGQGNFNMRVGP